MEGKAVRFAEQAKVEALEASAKRHQERRARQAHLRNLLPHHLDPNYRARDTSHLVEPPGGNTRR